MGTPAQVSQPRRAAETALRAPVLVVDHDAAVREVLREILEDVGYTVLDTADEATAMALLRARAEGMVVLCDVPGAAGTGRENERFFARVAAEPALADRHAYICLTTNVAGVAPALRRQLAAWSIPVLAKPFELDDVLDEVARMQRWLMAARTHQALVRSMRVASATSI